MNEQQDPVPYNDPTLCKWEENDMKCKNKAVHKGYCDEHAKKVYPDYGLGAATGAGIGGLIAANPIGIIVGIAVGIGLIWYLANKGK